MTGSIAAPLRRWDPERIGPYLIIGKLGAGAMGQVYLASSPGGRLVAVKTIRVDMAEEPGFRARFAREVAAARRVSGVFTASVIEADPEADLPWVATAYVPAPSLRTMVRMCGPLPVPAVRWLAAGCAEALQSIHRAGLLHRDIKPSNVLVAADGPRVIDFGVARAAERIELTATHGAAGTPAYMAPELARDARAASPASDVFSLGATLAFAATGHSPYRGDTVMDILIRLATEAPDLTGVPAELADLIGGCLERVPRDRPTDGAILEGLGSFDHLAGAGHSYLPDSAMALIAEYQHGPAGPDAAGDAFGGEGPGSWPTDGSGGQTAGEAAGADDDTSGSHTPLPGFQPPAALAAAPGGPETAPAWGHGRLLARTRWAWAITAGLAAALLAAGAGIGIALGGPGPPPPHGPGPMPPPTCQPTGGTAPQVCISQPFGDGETVFVIHGTGFAPLAEVTVSIAGVGTSRYHPVADLRGSFNYAIDQGHYFFPGQIPPGNYTALVDAPGGGSLRVSFQVHPANPGGGPPPGGAGGFAPPPGA